MGKLTMSIKEVAQQLNVSLPTAYELTKSKDFPVLSIGRRRVIPVEALQVWVEKNSKPQTQQSKKTGESE